MASKLQWYGDRVIREVNATMARRSKRAAAHLLKVAQAEAPFLSGELRDSGHLEPGDKPTQTLTVFDAPHAGYVEFGTSRQRANPFFRRAISKAQSELADIMAGRGESVFGNVAGAIGGLAGRIFGLR